MNKFLSILKTAEQKVAAVLRGAAKAEPAAVAIADTAAIAAGCPEFVPFIGKIGNVLVGAGAAVDAISAAPGNGAAKLAVAAPLVDQLVKNSGFLSDKVIADEAKWSAAITGITSNLADLLNAVSEKPAAQ